MKKTFGAIVGLAILIFLGTSGLFEPITNVFVWLITLQIHTPDISIFGQLIAKYGTWMITYTLVGALFHALGWFDSNAMKIVYFIVSTIISFALSWLLMIFETYLWIIAIVIGVLLIMAIGVGTTLFILKKKRNVPNNQKENLQ